MNLETIFLYLILALATLCIIYVAPRLARPLLAPLLALGTDSNSLTQRVFPRLAFVGVLGILLMLTLF